MIKSANARLLNRVKYRTMLIDHFFVGTYFIRSCPHIDQYTHRKIK